MERYDPQRMELSTRDIVARAIYTEVAEGRGSPRGGVYLDVSHLPADDGAEEAAEHVRTSSWSSPASTSRRGRWRSGRRATTSWAAIRVDAETAKSRVVGLFAAGECAGGLSGATRLGGNSLSDLLVFGRRAGEAAAGYAAEGGRRRDRRRRGRDGVRRARRASSPTTATIPYALHAELQQTMQRNVGIFRDEAGLTAAVDAIEELKAAGPQPPRRRGRSGASTRAGTSGCDLRNMLVCAEAIARAALRPARSRAARTAASTSRSRPTSGAAAASSASCDGDGGWRSTQQPVVTVDGARAAGRRAARAGAAYDRARVRALARRRVAAASSSATRPRPREGTVVLDAVHEIQRTSAPDLAVRWNCKAAKCGSCGAEVNGKPRLMCKTRLDDLPADRPDPRLAAAGVPDHPRPRQRRLVELRGEQADPAVLAEARREVADAAGGRRADRGVPQVHRVLPLPERLPRAPRPRAEEALLRPALPRPHRARSRCTRSTTPTAPSS